MLQITQSAKSKNGKTLEYQPELSEFNMLVMKLRDGEQEVLQAIKGPSVMIVTKGHGKMRAREKNVDLKEGWVFFIGQGVETEFIAEKELEVFRAYAE